MVLQKKHRFSAARVCLISSFIGGRRVLVGMVAHACMVRGGSFPTGGPILERRDGALGGSMPWLNVALGTNGRDVNVVRGVKVGFVHVGEIVFVTIFRALEMFSQVVFRSLASLIQPLTVLTLGRTLDTL